MIIVTCQCGRRLQQHEAHDGLKYTVEFREPDQRAPIRICPGCRLDLYELLKHGLLKEGA